MKHYSRQREAVLKELQSRCDHPTAAQVYEGVRKTIPNISLGTVYRNLSELVANGDILSVSVGDGVEHFDGDISFHLHQHCRRCGIIIDVNVCDDSLNEFARYNGFKPETQVCVVYGICKNCSQKAEFDKKQN